jgi:GT2 family glycosyltransferase
MNVDISIVIVSWNDRQHLEECLRSLFAPATSRRLQVIVVDNSSSDGSPEMVENQFPEVTLFRNSENLGFAKANNLGIRASVGQYVCLINSDVRVLEGCLDGLAAEMDRQTDIGIIGPRVLNRDLTHQSSCRRFPTLWNNLSSAMGLSRLFRRSVFFSGEHMFYFDGARAAEVDVLVGCFWMARREAINEFGLLDEGFFMYGEDVDWCKRCVNSGWRVTFFPGAHAIHYQGGSSSKKDAVWVELTQQRSLLRLWRKHHGRAGQIGIRSLLALHRAIRCGGALAGLLFPPSSRALNRGRLRLNWICLRDILVHRSSEGSSSLEPTPPAAMALSDR